MAKKKMYGTANDYKSIKNYYEKMNNFIGNNVSNFCSALFSMFRKNTKKTLSWLVG